MIASSRKPTDEHDGRHPVDRCALRPGVRHAGAANLCVRADVVHSATMQAKTWPMPLSSSPLLPTVGCERGDGT
jgi:hypothetical protein